MTKLRALLMTAMMMVGLSGCETMEGFGRDLGKLGDTIEDAADKSSK